MNLIEPILSKTKPHRERKRAEHLFCLCILLLHVTANASTFSTSWSYSGSATHAIVASPKFAGYYAAADAATDTVEIRDIRDQLLRTLTTTELQTLMGTSSISENGYGPCALAFSDSGRQLFIAVRGQSAGAQDAILSYNTISEHLRVFTTLDIPDGIERLPMMHSGGILYLGSTGFIIRYSAQRNDSNGTLLTPLSLPVDNSTFEVTGLASEPVSGKIFVSTTNALLSALITTNTDTLYTTTAITNIQDIAMARTYGADGQGGLYLLRNGGMLDYIPTAQIRAGSTYTNSTYSSIAGAVNLAATPCGRLLARAENQILLLSDTSDTRMDFETWVQNAFEEHLLYAKSFCWPNGTLEGLICDHIGRTYASNYASADNAAHVIYTLILADHLLDDPDARDLTAVILRRHAALQPDGKQPELNPDGIYPHWLDMTTAEGSLFGTFSVNLVYSSALHAREYWKNDPEIVALCEALLARLRNLRDYTTGNGTIVYSADSYGPSGYYYGGFTEIYSIWEMNAAQGTMGIRTFDNYWSNRNQIAYSTPLTGTNEPRVYTEDHPAFISLYNFGTSKRLREESSWREEFDGQYALHSAWTDDHAPHYFTVFSAGHGTTGYQADTVNNHPGNATHFPALIGFSSMGNTAPAVAAYMAYRDGRRATRFHNSRYARGAEIMLRYANSDPDWQDDIASLVDSGFASWALAELIEPGVLTDILAMDIHRDTVLDTSGPSTVLDFSSLDRQWVLGSENGTNWIPLGYQLSPYTFPNHLDKIQYAKTERREGDPVGLRNPDFNAGHAIGWTHANDFALSFPSNCISGASPQFLVSDTSTNSTDNLSQNLVLTNDFAGTRYRIRAVCRTEHAGLAAKGYLRCRWDNASTWYLGTDVSADGEWGELHLETTKPTGASSMLLELVAEKVSGTGNATVTFDEVSIERMGANLAHAAGNGDFEQGSLSGFVTWTSSANGSSTSITANPSDVFDDSSYACAFHAPQAMPNGELAGMATTYDTSSDPLGTRYVLRAEVRATALEGSEFILAADILDSGQSILWTKTGDRLRQLETEPARLYFTHRKRDASESGLKALFILQRKNQSNITADERVILDNIELVKTYQPTNQIFPYQPGIFDDQTDLGCIPAGTNRTATFSVVNLGQTILPLLNAPVDTDHADFSATQPTNTLVSPGTGLEFDVTYTPSSPLQNTNAVVSVSLANKETVEFNISGSSPDTSTTNGTPTLWLYQNQVVVNDDYEVSDLFDFDGDGLSSGEEYIAGTLPANASSVFRTDIFEIDPVTGTITLKWFSTADRNYRLLSSTNLHTWTVATNDIPATPPLNQLTLPFEEQAPARFIKLEVYSAP